MYEKYISFLIRYRYVLIIVCVLAIALASKGLERIVMVSDYKSFLDKDYPRLLELEKIESIFRANHNLLIAVAPKDGVVFKAETIELLQQMTEQSWLLPYASRVDSLTNYQHTDVNGDDLVVGDLLPQGELITSQLLARASHIAANEPEIKHNLISLDQTVAVVSVTFDIPAEGVSADINRQIIIAVDNMVDHFRRLNPDNQFHITGILLVDDALSKYGQKDSQTLIPAMLLLMVIVLLFMTRSFSGVFSASLVVIFTGIGTLGLLGWTGWIIDPGSAVSPIVIMTLAVADSIHIIEGMQKAMRDGMDKLAAVKESLRDNWVPVFLTSLTTVMGVVTFTFAEMPSLRRLGITVALGVSIAFVLSVTLLPALLSLLPMRVPRERKPSPIFAWFAEFAIRYYKIIVSLVMVVALVLIGLVPLNRFNDSPSSMLALSTPERQAIEFYEDHVSGVVKIDVAIFSDKSGGVNDPAFLGKAEEFTRWLRAQETIDHVTSLTDIVKRLNQNMHGNDSQWYRLPESKELAAQYLLLYEMSLPYGLDLNNQLDQDKSAIRMTVIMGRADSQKVVETQRAIEAWFINNAPQLRAVVTGSTPIVAELSYVYMIPSMMKGGVIAILMVSFVLFIALRSVKLGFIGMLANILPVSMGYGLWYLINGQVNFFIASVAGVCLGVVVDFAVHYLSKYQRSRLAGNGTEEAIRYAFTKTGRPLWTTMVVLVSGFWLLTLSAVTLNSGMGLLTGIVIILALLFDFIVLPALLMVFDRHRKIAF